MSQFTYKQFLERKIRLAECLGFDINVSEIHPILKPHQKAIVQWLVKTKAANYTEQQARVAG